MRIILVLALSFFLYQPKKVEAQENLNFSVLSKGKWYKLAVKKNGIYKISYKDLKSLGIDPSIINPHNIKIYGNGGGMLPENNKSERY